MGVEVSMARDEADVGDEALWSRRAILGLAAGVGLLGPAVAGLPGSLLRAEEPRAGGPAPGRLATDQLARGLFALSREHRGWFEGHHGAGIIASHYFCVDNGLDERTVAAVRANAAAYMAHRPADFPEPDPGPGTADPAGIAEELDLHVHELRSGGHDAIYAALALRALRDLPHLATPSVVDGVRLKLRQHVGAYRPVQPSRYALEHPLEPYGGSGGIAAATLRAALRPWEHVRQVGASGVLHWVTHAEALVTLEELGYPEVARHGYTAHQVNVNRPVEPEGGGPPSRQPLDWLGPAYWESDAPRRLGADDWLVGHAFKLPHSLFRLVRLVEDEDLRRAALVRGALLLAPFDSRPRPGQ
jgi:hypothetical protein